MIYAGDTYNFICSLVKSDKTLYAVVTTPPLITVFNLAGDAPVVTSQAMTAVPGTDGLYVYTWAIPNTLPNGEYVAIVSYAADTTLAQNQFLDKVRVGDSNITGQVALNATVAKDATVSKDATVTHLTDLASLNPATNTTIQAILTQVNRLPTDPASNTALSAVSALVSDCRDFAIGNWTIDKTQNPPVLTLTRVNGLVLAKFTMTETAIVANRQQTT